VTQGAAGDAGRGESCANGASEGVVDEGVINYTYLSKIESEKLDFGPYPSEELIRRLAEALGADVDELLLLAKKIPAGIRDRVLQRPDAFRKLASLDDVALDEVIRQVERRKARC
jgi:hypothetical protein